MNLGPFRAIVSEKVRLLLPIFLGNNRLFCFSLRWTPKTMSGQPSWVSLWVGGNRRQPTYYEYSVRHATKMLFHTIGALQKIVKLMSTFNSPNNALHVGVVTWVL